MNGTVNVNNSQIDTLKDTCGKIADLLEPYNKMSKEILINFISIMKDYIPDINIKMFGIAESFSKTMNVVQDEDFSFLSTVQLTESMSSTFAKLVDTMKMYDYSTIYDSLKQVTESASWKNIKISSEYINAFSKILNENCLKDSLLSVINNIDTHMDQDNFEGNSYYEEQFTQDEIKQALEEQVSNPKGFQERVATWAEKKKKKYYIIYIIIFFLVSNFIKPYFNEYIGIPVTAYVVSNVKKLPKKGSEIIGHIKEDMEAIITENVNYYYKVSYIDENGNKREGYVAKRNLRQVEAKFDNDVN